MIVIFGDLKLGEAIEAIITDPSWVWIRPTLLAICALAIVFRVWLAVRRS